MLNYVYFQLYQHQRTLSVVAACCSWCKVCTGQEIHPFVLYQYKVYGGYEGHASATISWWEDRTTLWHRTNKPTDRLYIMYIRINMRQKMWASTKILRPQCSAAKLNKFIQLEVVLCKATKINSNVCGHVIIQLNVNLPTQKRMGLETRTICKFILCHLIDSRCTYSLIFEKLILPRQMDNYMDSWSSGVVT